MKSLYNKQVISEITIKSSNSKSSAFDNSSPLQQLDYTKAINEEMNFIDQIPVTDEHNISKMLHHDYINSNVLKASNTQTTNGYNHSPVDASASIPTNMHNEDITRTLFAIDNQNDINNQILPITELLKENSNNHNTSLDNDNSSLERWLQKPIPEKDAKTPVNKTLVSVAIAILTIALLFAIYISGVFSSNTRPIEKLVGSYVITKPKT